MQYVRVPGFMRSVRRLYKRGGSFRKASEKAEVVWGRITSGHTDPYEGFKRTHHGETRIRKCQKYDLPGRCRLITVVRDDHCYLLYVGSHDECDAWLDGNRGWEPRMDNEGRLESVFTSGEDLESDTRIQGSGRHRDWLDGELYRRLDEADFDLLLDGVPRSICRKLETVQSTSEESEILQLVGSIGSSEQRTAVHDIFMLLRRGDLKGAEVRLVEYKGHLRVPDGDARNSAELRLVDIDPEGSERFMHFIRTAEYADWMLFPHPDQEELVEAEFRGAAKLLGVSGSGKTCVVVKRAVALAERYEEAVLVLTLNRPLASLIQDLVDNCCHSGSIRQRITVRPFFVLCQEYLRQFEPENDKLYDDRTWKTEEHIDEIWREYYRCETNNRDAACMQSVHDALISQGIDAERYIREEFDWIRSAVPPDDRDRYLDLARKGRSHPLNQDQRTALLEGLEGWEEKMTAVGVTDHLGIATAMSRHLELLRPRYRAILIDECQDFGTIEMELIARLVDGRDDRPDGLFLCGDAAQHASWKHQSLAAAGVRVPGARSRKLEQNYRNSRDILSAAQLVLEENMTDDMLANEDAFEILDPKYANFGGQSPVVLEADSLEREIAQAVEFAREEVASAVEEERQSKACVAFCGYSMYEVGEFAKSNGVPVLEEGLDIVGDESLFFSDLEQTKGFEFQTMVIVNVRDGVIPNPAMPLRERFRDLCRLYVAMTRATLQLVLSFSEEPSQYVRKAVEKDSERFLRDSWASYSSATASSLRVPRRLETLRARGGKRSTEVSNMTGEEFLYSSGAVGVSRDLASKLRLHVTGQENRWGTPRTWSTLSRLAEDARTFREVRRLLGPKAVSSELEQLVIRLGRF